MHMSYNTIFLTQQHFQIELEDVPTEDTKKTCQQKCAVYYLLAWRRCPGHLFTFMWSSRHENSHLE